MARGRRRISSGGPWEAVAGYSRAVVIGDSCWVAGTTDAGPDGVSQHPGDVAAQARAALAIIERALIEGGFTLFDVVRTRMFLADVALSDEVSAVHGEVFRDIRPAATMVAVAGLMHPSLLVEIEVDAHRAKA
jgi:enamine deaminase RidA (YjgF/YER057c/UK114 family)